MKTSRNRNFAALALLSTTVFYGVSSARSAPATNGHKSLAAATQKRVAALVQFAGRSGRDLNLSAAQQTKLRALAQRNVPLAKAIWSDSSLSQTQKMGKIRLLQARTLAVFTPTQKRKLEIAKTNAMMKLFDTAGWVSTELDLSASQKTKIRDIVLENYRRGSAGAGSFGALRGLITDANNRIDAALNPSQRVKWNVIKGTARREFAKNARDLAAMNLI